MEGDNTGLQRHQPRGGVLAVVSTVAKYPRTVSAVFLWIFGLYVCLYATSPIVISQEQEAEYYRGLLYARPTNIKGYMSAHQRVMRLQEELMDAKVWFWRFRAGHREHVYAVQEQLDHALAGFRELEAQRVQREQDARGVVGIWSEIGIADARDLFWQCYEHGKDLARRWTFIDMLFTVGRRDEELVVTLLRLGLAFISNLTVGLLSGVVVFLWNLWSLIVSYQSSLWSGLLFFLVAAVGAVSVAATYVMVVTGVIGTAGYYLIKASGPRLEQRARQRLHVD